MKQSKSGFVPCEAPPGAVDIGDAAAASYAIERAVTGDYEPLLARLRLGEALPIEQALIADIYDGRVKRRRQRPKRINAQARDLYLALCVASHVIKGASYKGACALVAEEEREARSTVYSAAQQHADLFPSK
jgi:hypothetical protein